MIKYWKVTADYRPNNPEKPSYYFRADFGIKAKEIRGWFERHYSWLNVYKIEEVDELDLLKNDLMKQVLTIGMKVSLPVMRKMTLDEVKAVKEGDFLLYQGRYSDMPCKAQVISQNKSSTTVREWGKPDDEKIRSDHRGYGTQWCAWITEGI